MPTPLSRNHWLSAMDYIHHPSLSTDKQIDFHMDVEDEDPPPKFWGHNDPSALVYPQDLEKVNLPYQSSDHKQRIIAHRINSTAVYREITERLDPKPLPYNAESSANTITATEGFLIKYYVDVLGQTMNLYAADSFYTHVVPSIALKERVVLDTICALSALSLAMRNPGTVRPDTPDVYRDHAEKAIVANIESSDYDHRLLHLLCFTALILFDMVSKDMEYLDKKLSYSYKALKELSYQRPSRAENDNRSYDLFTITSGLSFAIDIIYNSKEGTCTHWEPDLMQKLLIDDKVPWMYTNEWWIRRVFVLIARLQEFANKQTAPTFEEYQNKSRFREWEKIYTDIIAYGHDLPQTLRAYAVTERDEHFSFPNVHVFGEYALMTNVLFHSAIICAKHLRPDMTEKERKTVPSGSIYHAYKILSLLSCCQKPTLWIAIFWAHRMAAICLDDPNERDKTLDLSRQYEWRSGYMFSKHVQMIKTRWNEMDEYKKHHVEN